MKKSGIILLFVIFCTALYGQTFPHPVFIRVTAEGKIEQQTFNTLVPCPVLSREQGYPVECESVTMTTHGDRTDTSRNVRAGRSNTFSFTHFSIQDAYRPASIYPEDPESGMPGFTWLPSKSDSIITREFWIHGWVCSNGGEYSYTITQEWHLNKKRDRVMKVIVTRDSTPVTRQYSYLPDGRMQNILITGGRWGYDKFYPDTATTEFVYDDQKRCTAICTHSGPPYLYPPGMIAIWKQELDSAFRKNQRFNLAFSYRGMRLKELITYSYSGKLLTSSLSFNEAFSALYSDSLFYNEKDQLIRSRFYRSEIVDEMTFTYDQQGRVASKSEICYYDFREPSRNGLKSSETYSYGKQGRMSMIDYHYTSEDYPNHTLVHIYYPKDK